MLHLCLLILCAAVFMPGCRASKPEKPPKTEQEVRAMQSKMFDAVSVKCVMQSLLAVLQEEGYVMKNVALDLGFISAAKEVEIEEGSERFFSQFTKGEGRWLKTELTEATLTITEMGKNVRVRAHFQAKKVDNRGVVQQVDPISDSDFYDEFFDKVEKHIQMGTSTL